MNPDIICLQEVSEADLAHINESFEKEKAYSFIHTFNESSAHHGLLFGYKNSKFKLKDAVEGDFVDMSSGETDHQNY